MHGQTRQDGRGDGGAARLAQKQRRIGIDVDEHFLHCHLTWGFTRDQVREIARDNP